MKILNETVEYINKTIKESKKSANEPTGNQQFDNGFNVALNQSIRKLERIKNQIENYIFLEQNK